MLSDIMNKRDFTNSTVKAFLQIFLRLSNDAVLELVNKLNTINFNATDEEIASFIYDCYEKLSEQDNIKYLRADKVELNGDDPKLPKQFETTNLFPVERNSNLITSQSHYPNNKNAIHYPHTVIIDNQSIKLTPRESTALYYLCQGFSTKETARFMNISPRTVEQYLVTLREKFGCRTKLALLSKIQSKNLWPK